MPPGFGARLRALREERHLSRAELAGKAGITERSVANYESDARGRLNQKNLMLVAEALGVSYRNLIGGEEAERSRWFANRNVLVAIALVLAVASGLAARHHSVQNARWTLSGDGRHLEVRDSILGTLLWSHDSTDAISSAARAPWDRDILVFALGGKYMGRGSIQAWRLSTGDSLWATAPDLELMERAFGPEILAGGNMSGRRVRFLDADGDGESEIVAEFVHSLYYPSAVCRIGRDGRLLNQYCSRGHVGGLLVADHDGDGRDEVIATGVNNVYGGPTVFILDDDHWSGASVDSLAPPRGDVPDSALVRYVGAAFPESYHGVMGDTRLRAIDPTLVTAADGSSQIRVSVCPSDPRNIVTLFLDGDLNATGSVVADMFAHRIRTQWPDSLTDGAGPLDRVWRERWLSRAVRFEAGHWPPAIGAAY